MTHIKRIDEFNQQRKRAEHLMLDTSYGEVLVIQNEGYCEVYIGDNYDDYLGDIDCNITDNESYIKKLVEELFG